jgi:hypothetical protein
VTVSFKLPGQPRTKKTSQRIVHLTKMAWNEKARRMEKRTFPQILPSEEYEAWFKGAMTFAPAIRAAVERSGVRLPITGYVAISAQFYRPTNTTGDLLGYEQALADWLQVPKVSKKGKKIRDGAGIIEDDRFVSSWDGSRLKVCRERPRIEVTITAVESLFDQIGDEGLNRG